MNPRLQELLAKVKQSKLAAARPVARTTTEQGVPLNPERRAENLRLLRAFLNSTQDELATVLRLGSQSYFSGCERGVQKLTVGEARRIELDLDLPDGWMERNNADSLFLSQAELDLILELRRSKGESVQMLTSFVRAIRD